MDNIFQILKEKAQLAREPAKLSKTKIWQYEALEAIKKLNDGEKYRGQIFKCFKNNRRFAKLALSDSLELNKPLSLYYLKVYYSLINTVGAKNNSVLKFKYKNEAKHHPRY